MCYEIVNHDEYNMVVLSLSQLYMCLGVLLSVCLSVCLLFPASAVKYSPQITLLFGELVDCLWLAYQSISVISPIENMQKNHGTCV